MESSPLKEIASELPFFKTVNEREKLLGVVGALVLRQVSLSKAAEIMGMGKEAFLELLDAMRVELTRSGDRAFTGLGLDIFQRHIVTEPEPGKSLKDELEGLKSYRISRFRIIYRISSKYTIDVVAV